MYLLCFHSFAQFSAVDYKSKAYEQFKASKTYIVKTGDTRFDKALAEAMTELWTITPTQVIDDETFESMLKDKTASFMLLVTIRSSHEGQSYHYLAIINGGKKKLYQYQYDDMLAYCPINHFQNERVNTDCYYRVRNMIQSMIQAMDIVEKNDIRGMPLTIVNRLRDIYKTKANIIRKRTLLFCKETMGDKLSESDIAKIYPYKFEICDQAKIEQVIKDKSKDYFYFQPAITLNKSMFVFDPSNGEVVYCDYQTMGLNINRGNIEDLVKAIE